ncbi:MAG: PadR family transcriptional regulator [Rhodospirillales bacterium]|nr:PadR family transcriptional regulator [Rhodospirillales bacterium]
MDAKTLCLGVLTLGDASGYEIKKHFEEGPFAHFHAAGFGSIYPALNALLREGHVTRTETTQTGRPDKKIYKITEAGRKAFRHALHKDPAPDSYRSEAIFMMFFSDLLDGDQVRHVYDEYLAKYRTRADRMARQDSCSCQNGQRFVHGLGLAIYRAVVSYMEQNRGLLLAPHATQQGGGAASVAE